MSERQSDLPLAVVRGEPLSVLPDDLYIPPDALAIILEAFEGPLDLLLYLIRRQNIDISDIPIAAITEQYMVYVELMRDFNLDLAAEYLVMAAMLAEIKSRVLLPRHAEAEADEGDPRAQLVQRLREYEQFKQAAQDLDHLPRLERDHWQAQTEVELAEVPKPEPAVELRELLVAFQAVLQQADMFSRHHIKREQLSIRARMSSVLEHLQQQPIIRFQALFNVEEGRHGVVVSLMAVLELLKAQLIDIKQADEPYAPLYVCTVKSA